MAVHLRMTRIGRAKVPRYRIVAADQRSPRDGRNIETLGYYNPVPNPPDFKLDLVRVDYWLGVGAKASESVTSLIKAARRAAAAQPASQS